MQRLFALLNTSFGLLVSGAIISGLCVQYITSSWQQRNWVFEQQFTSGKSRFEKELDQKYKVLEDINTAVATILAHSQFVTAGHTKGVSPKQLSQHIANYNEAALKWETDFRLYSIRLKTLFVNAEILAKWDDIKKKRDKLDVAIYELTQKNTNPPEDSLQLIETISSTMIDLSRRIIYEISDMKHSDFKSK